MIRIAIVEDEEQSVQIIQKHLTTYCHSTGHQIKTIWFKDGLDFISDYENTFDLVFMDIKMPHLDGMSTARKLRDIDQTVALIFITNMMQYAIKGYEVNALDFIVKPVKYFDFEMKMNKAIEYIRKHRNDSISIDVGDIKVILPVSEIYYIEVLNHTLIFHTIKGEYKTYGQLFKMEETLQNNNFARCNNCYLINLRHINEVHPNHIIVGGDTIQISRRKKKEFLEQFTNYMGSGK